MSQLFRFTKIILIGIVAALLLIALIFGHRDIPVNDLKAKYANEASEFVTISGMLVHYRDEGNPKDSLPIVLIHGTSSSLHTYDHWTEILSQNRRVVRMDLPGFGLTGPFAERNYSISNYVDFLETFLTELNIDRYMLAGNSLGGQIAWNFTVEYPVKVEKLLLIDAAGYPFVAKSRPIAFTLARIPIVKHILTFITPRFLARSSVENVYADKSKVTDELVDRYFELTLRAGNRQALIDRFATSLDTEAHLNLKNIQVPTLILWGEEDQLIPLDNAYRFHAAMPNDTLIVLKNLGHVPMEESPKKSLNAVNEFLSLSGPIQY